MRQKQFPSTADHHRGSLSATWQVHGFAQSAAESLNYDTDLPPQSVEYGNLKSYLIGFAASIVLTLAAYFLAIQHPFTGWKLDASVALFALIQASLQLLLFLNLAREARPRWNVLVFLFMLMVILILVVGSLWIMYHLNYNMMPK